MNKILPEEISNDIYDILVEDLNATARFTDRQQFVQSFSHPGHWEAPKEYRFGGTYGMAGKFWWNNGKFYATGWSRGEVSGDYHDQQEADLKNVNLRLAEVYEKYLSART